jgi:hypothetical protein
MMTYIVLFVRKNGKSRKHAYSVIKPYKIAKPNHAKENNE